LPWNVNRKSDGGYVTVPMTLSQAYNPGFNITVYLQVEYLS